MTADSKTLPGLRPGKALYAQLADAIARHMQENNLPKGHKLPSQSELMASYGVSQATVRQALLNLSNRGLVRAEQGRGVFVDEPRIKCAIGDFSLLTKANGDSARVNFEYLGSELIFAPERVADMLGISTDDQMTRIRRKISADMRLIGLETSNMPLSTMQVFSKHDLEERDIRAVLYDHPQMRICRTELKIGASLITDFDRDTLSLSSDTIVLQREETHFAKTGSAVLMQRTVLLAAQIDLVTEAHS